MFEVDTLFASDAAVAAWLCGTLAVLNVVSAAICIRLLRQFAILRRVQGQQEQMSTALTLLTEATESGFRWTTSELQRVTAIVRRSRWPQDVQPRLEQAITAGKTVQQIASEEGLPESEVQLRAHLACAGPESGPDKEAHGGALQ